jgi:CSLREA domain-containing protein
MIAQLLKGFTRRTAIKVTKYMPRRKDSILTLLLSLFVILFLASGFVPGSAPVARAADFTVGCGDTAGLISAINSANSNAGSNLIDLAPGCTYVLSGINNTTSDGPNGLPDITGALTINGHGSTVSRNSPSPVFRIFHIASSGNLTVNNLTISGADSASSTGGGMYNLGTVVINGSTFSNNKAIFGSAINNLGVLTITGSLFTNNSISQAGTILSTGVLTVDKTTFSNNSANNGAGIYAGGMTTITNSTFVGNLATTNDGGAIFANGGTMSITNSTFSGNTAAGTGGGLVTSAGTPPTVKINNSTFFGNKAAIGGGVRVWLGSATLQNTIVANSLAGGNCSRTASAGHNLSSDATCGGGPGDILKTNPKLGPLADNGGPTQTLALLPGSPAVDRGNNATCATTDQRGVPRPVGPACDIGAYELDLSQPGPVFTVNSAADPGDGACTKLDCTLREAINAANQHANGSAPDTIQFNIPGTGPFTISPASSLPTLSDPVNIDGYTQPGATPNTLPAGDNAILQIEINLSNSGGSGLTLNANNNTVRGLVINRSSQNQPGIMLNGNNNVITGDFIGVDTTGRTALGNSGPGITINNSGKNVIGGTQPAFRNVISGNGTDGILIQGAGATGNQVLGNIIGLAVDGQTSLGNTDDGVEIQANNNQIGGQASGAGNFISANGSHGVNIVSGNGNAVLSNSIFSNNGLGIRLAPGANNDPVSPILVNAIPQANGTLLQGLLAGRANTTFNLQFFSNPVCDASNFGEGQNLVSQALVTTDISGTANISTTVQALSGIQFVSATSTDPNGNTSAFAQCAVTDQDNTSWPGALSLGSAGASPQVFGESQYLGQLGQSRWYKVALQPGTQVSIKLTDLPASYDLMVFTDINSAYQASAIDPNSPTNAAQSLLVQTAELGATAFNPGNLAPDTLNPQTISPEAYSLQALQPGIYSTEMFAPYAFSPYAFSPYAFSPYAFSPYAFSPYAFSPYAFSPYAFSPYAFSPYAFSPASQAFVNAQARSLIAVSALDGTAERDITFNTWNNQGDYYIRVLGRNGAFSLSAPYTLQVLTAPGGCASVDSSTLPPTNPLTDPNNGYQTIILTDWSRLTETPDLQSALDRFTAEVNGVLVDVGQDARVAAANSLADQNTGCPFAKNLVADSIKAIVDQYRTRNQGLKYVVILGSDNVIPLFRYPDQSMLGDESGFVPPVNDQTASQASLRLNFFLSQDAYGSSINLAQNASVLPLPDLAVGRLVEQPSEITNMLNAYLNGTDNGVVSPTSALVTGYDFMSSGAAAIQAQLQSGMNATVDSLIAPQGQAPAASWTANDLRAKLLQNHYDLMYLTGHFRDSGMLAADYQTQILAAEVISSSVNMANTIILSAGCHVGYNTVDGAIVNGVTDQPDWAQAFARKGATLIGGTGYQYGDTDFIALSQQLYLDIAEQLRMGNGPVSLGAALIAAKQQYLSSKPTMRGIDQKTLLEATLFGLPMLSVNLPGRINPPAEPSIVNTLSGYSTDPGASLGLSSADITLTPALTLQSQTLNATNSTSTVSANYYSGSNGVVSNPAEPVLPLETRNVTVPGQVLRGVGFLGASYSDTRGVTALTGAAGTELRGVHVTFPTNVFYPLRPWNVNYYGALSGDGSTRLMVTPSQFQAEATNSQIGTLRAFGPMSFRLFYSNNTTSYQGNFPALADPPSIAHVFANSGGGSVTFHVNVTGDPSAGIQQVWVTYTDISDPSGGTWQSLFLTQNSSDSTLWDGAIVFSDPANIRYMVQAVNGVGLVALDANLGAYFTPDIDPASPSSGQPTALGTTLSLTSSPASSAYGDQVTFNALLQTSTGSPLANLPVSFNLGQQGLLISTNNEGQASFTLTLLGTPGVYIASVAFNGTSNYIGSSTSAGFTILKQNTSLTLSPGTVDVRPGDDTALVATLQDTAAPASHPLNEQTIIFVIQPDSGPADYVVAITNVSGQARLGPAPITGGTYQVTVYYGASPVPGAPLDVRYNSSNSTGTLQVDFPPDTSITGNPPNVSNVNSASFNFTGTDDLTPANSLAFECRLDGGAFSQCFSPLTINSLSNGNHTFQVRAVDSLGPDATPASYTWLIDSQPPIISCGSPDVSWHAADVNIACSAGDSGAGLANLADSSFNLTTNVSAGVETATAATGSRQVCDLAGNCTTAGPVTGIKVDKKAPSIVITSPGAGPYKLNQVVMASYACSDGGSGIASCTGSVANGSSINTSTPGSNQFTVTAIDVAGNSTTATVTYQVLFNFSGFFEPVDNPPVINVVNAGKAIPIKFSLGGNFGLSILAAGFPTSQNIACPSGTLDTVETTVYATTSSLSFDAGAKKYIYVWKTDSSWAGTCRQFTLKLSDGTVHLAIFKFK